MLLSQLTRASGAGSGDGAGHSHHSDGAALPPPMQQLQQMLRRSGQTAQGAAEGGDHVAASSIALADTHTHAQARWQQQPQQPQPPQVLNVVHQGAGTHYSAPRMHHQDAPDHNGSGVLPSAAALMSALQARAGSAHDAP